MKNNNKKERMKKILKELEQSLNQNGCTLGIFEDRILKEVEE